MMITKRIFKMKTNSPNLEICSNLKNSEFIDTVLNETISYTEYIKTRKDFETLHLNICNSICTAKYEKSNSE